MTRGSFSTMICHNGGDRIRQREQGYRISSVGRRYEDSLFSWVGTDGCHLCPGNNSVRVITALRPSFCSLYLHAAPPAISAFAVSALARETAKLSCIRYRYHTQNICPGTSDSLRVDRSPTDYKLNVKIIKKV